MESWKKYPKDEAFRKRAPMEVGRVGYELLISNSTEGGVPSCLTNRDRKDGVLQLVEQSRLLVRRFLDVSQGRDEISKDLRRDHDGVAIATDIFCDFHHASALVFFEIHKKDLSIRENFFGM